MKTSSIEVLKTIPDFDDFMKLADEISQLMYTKLYLESEIKNKESDVFKVATTDSKYFQGGKPPATSYVENTYKYTGFDNELMPLRQELSKVVSELENRRIKLDVYKSMIDVWRTLSSSERSASL